MLSKKTSILILAIFLIWIALSAYFNFSTLSEKISNISLFQEDKNLCFVCNREIHTHMGVILNTKTNGKVEACCPQCATHYEEDTGDKVLDMLVTDYYTGKLIDSKNAFYVIGGNLSPCCRQKLERSKSGEIFQTDYDRCLPTIIAFETRKNALKYLRVHGGKIATYSLISKRR